MIETILVLPTPPALLSPRSAVDPVADLRAACHAALAEVREPIIVIAAPVSAGNATRGITEPLGHRVARDLLGARPFVAELALPWAAASLIEQDGRSGAHPSATTLVVMADGSARREERAPGHLHPGSVGFDADLEKALREGDAESLATLDLDLAEELWCEGGPSFRMLGEVARGRTRPGTGHLRRRAVRRRLVGRSLGSRLTSDSALAGCGHVSGGVPTSVRG